MFSAYRVSIHTNDQNRELSDGRFALLVENGTRTVELPSTNGTIVRRGLNVYTVTTSPIRSFDKLQLRWASNLRNANAARQIMVNNVTIEGSGTTRSFCGRTSPLRLTHTFWHPFNSTCVKQ